MYEEPNAIVPLGADVRGLRLIFAWAVLLIPLTPM